MKSLLLFALVLTCHFCYSQTCFFEVKQQEFKYYKNLENKISSLEWQSKDYNVPPDLANPIKFVRTNSGFHPSPIIEYFFTVPDSTVRRIHLEIDSTNFLPRNLVAMSGYSEPTSRLDEFNKQYEIIRKELISYFGKPKDTQSLKEKNGWWSRKDSWEKDSVEVIAYLGFDTSPGMGNRIRANIDYKYQKSFDATANERLMLKQDSIAKKYLSLIFKKDYEESWNLQDEELKKQLSYDKYVETCNGIYQFKNKKNKEIEPFHKGLKQNSAGVSMFCYSYKFSDNSSDPEKQLIVDILFKDKESSTIIAVTTKIFKRVK